MLNSFFFRFYKVALFCIHALYALLCIICIKNLGFSVLFSPQKSTKCANMSVLSATWFFPSPAILQLALPSDFFTTVSFQRTEVAHAAARVHMLKHINNVGPTIPWLLHTCPLLLHLPQLLHQSNLVIVTFVTFANWLPLNEVMGQLTMLERGVRSCWEGVHHYNDFHCLLLKHIMSMPVNTNLWPIEYSYVDRHVS